MRVAALWVYPVKSLGGVAVPAARVGALGLDGDRRWMLVDADGRFLSQREHPRMAAGRVALGTEGGGAPAGALTLSAPGVSPLTLTPPGAGAPRARVTVWGDVVDAALAPPDAHAWASAWLGAPVRLVYLPDDARRPVDPRYAGPGDRTAFTDGYPVLVASRASLDDLNRRLTGRGELPVGIERFRPSVLVEAEPGETLGAYAEDGWGALALGGGPGAVELALVKPCGRCVVTTIAQGEEADVGAGEARGPEPLRTLAGYRRHGSKVLFAQNAVVRREGVVRVGGAARAAPRASR